MKPVLTLYVILIVITIIIYFYPLVLLIILTSLLTILGVYMWIILTWRTFL